MGFHLLTSLQSARLRLEGSTLGARFARSALWSLTGTSGYQGLAILSLVLAARLLGGAEFGRLAMIQSTVGMFGVFGAVGLGVTATKYVAQYRDTDTRRAGRIVALSLAGCAVMAAMVSGALYGAAPFLAAGWLNDPGLAMPLRLACPLLFVNAILIVLLNVLAGFEAFGSIGKVNLLRGVTTVVGIAGGAFVAGLPGVVLGMAASSTVAAAAAAAASFRLSRRFGIPILSNCLPEWRLVFRFSVPAFLVSVAAWPAMWLVTSDLARQCGYLEVGLLNAAIQWRTAITVVPLLLTEPVLPIIANLLSEGRYQESRGLFRKNLFWGLGLSAAICVPVVAGSRYFLLAYGPDFAGGQPVFVLTTLSSLFIVAAAICAVAVISLDRMWSSFAIHVAWAVCLVPLAHLLARSQGARGVATAYLVAYALDAALFYLLARRCLLAAGSQPAAPATAKPYAATTVRVAEAEAIR